MFQKVVMYYSVILIYLCLLLICNKLRDFTIAKDSDRVLGTDNIKHKSKCQICEHNINFILTDSMKYEVEYDFIEIFSVYIQ